MEIVQRRTAWDDPSSDPTSGSGCWLDGVVVRPVQEIAAEVRNAPHPGLSLASWAALRPDEQEALRVQLISGIVLSERLLVLANLIERLQDKVADRDASLKACR